MVVVDILGLEHTLTDSFIKVKRIREALSNHSTNISAVNAAHSHLAFSTTLPHVLDIPASTLHQLHINMQLPEGQKGQSIPEPLVTYTKS